MDVALQTRAEQLANEIADQAKTIEDLNGLMRQMMKAGLERMLNTEMDVHLGRKVWGEKGVRAKKGRKRAKKGEKGVRTIYCPHGLFFGCPRGRIVMPNLKAFGQSVNPALIAIRQVHLVAEVRGGSPQSHALRFAQGHATQ